MSRIIPPLRNKPKFRFLSAWFCPYAHRATIAFEYHQKYIDYIWVEALGWYQSNSNSSDDDNNSNNNNNGEVTNEVRTKTTTPSMTNDNNNNNKEWYYHWKADELKRVNPSALVPTLIPIIYSNSSSTNSNGNDGTTTTTTTDDDSNTIKEMVDETKAVYESLVTIDYIDMVATQYVQQQQQQALDVVEAEVNTNTTTNDTSHQSMIFTSLVPYHDPYEVARCRIWTDKVNRECCSPYYDILVRQDPMERQVYFQKLLHGITNFANELQTTSGKTFLSNHQVCTVDIALFPWAYRYYVLQHYCGIEYSIPTDDPIYTPYHEWYQYMLSLPYIQRTLPDVDQYLVHIQKYANGTARSKVANAVRRGVPAHEIDDEKDEYK